MSGLAPPLSCKREPLIVVLTCPRAGVSYVEKTVSAIDREGGHGLPALAVVDGDDAAVADTERRIVGTGCRDWQVVGLDGAHGSTEAMRGALVRAAEHGRDVLFFEDDIVLCRNAVLRMRAVEVPSDSGCVAFFDMKEVTAGAAPGLYGRGVDRSLAWDFWGCQALRFSAEVVAWLAEQDWRRTWVGESRMASDLIVGALLRRYPVRAPVAVHIPCLVEHVGHSSACSPGQPLTPSRRATNFAGADFDALRLPRFAALTEHTELAC